MDSYHAIVLTNDMDIITLCKSIGEEIGIEIVYKADLANFLLGIQENNYQVALFDCPNPNSECLKWIRIIRKIRPKIPLIIFSDHVDRTTGAKIYEAGSFYLFLKPVHKQVLRHVFFAAISYMGPEFNPQLNEKIN